MLALVLLATAGGAEEEGLALEPDGPLRRDQHPANGAAGEGAQLRQPAVLEPEDTVGDLAQSRASSPRRGPSRGWQSTRRPGSAPAGPLISLTLSLAVADQ